jgi:predicted nucleotidyltransferase
MDNEQISVLLKVTRVLDECGIAYMVSGSTALNFYAKPRMTRDIDLVIELRETGVLALVGALMGEFYVDEQMVAGAVSNQSMFNAIHNDTLVKVDFIVRKDELYRKTEFERRRSVTLGTAQIMAVTPEDLILSKLLWSVDTLSTMQADDIRNLLNSAELDQFYLDHWAQTLGVSDRLLELHQK